MKISNKGKMRSAFFILALTSTSLLFSAAFAADFTAQRVASGEVSDQNRKEAAAFDRFEGSVVDPKLQSDELGDGSEQVEIQDDSDVTMIFATGNRTSCTCKISSHKNGDGKMCWPPNKRSYSCHCADGTSYFECR